MSPRSIDNLSPRDATSMSSFSSFLKPFSKTGKPKAKDAVRPLFLTQPFLSATLVSGNFRKLVVCPQGVDLNEWFAANGSSYFADGHGQQSSPGYKKVFEFFNYTNLFYGAIAEYCTPVSCPCMHGGPGFEYAWTDYATKRASKISAPQYADYVMTWMENLIHDEAVFPTRAGMLSFT